jgi:hypothetical protein
VVALLGVASCGDEDSPGDRDPSGGEETELTVTLDRDGPGGMAPEVAELRCPVDGGDAEACAAIDALPADAAEPVPPRTVCTQIYGGPVVVELEGTLRGSDVEAELNRANGCEIARFERFLPLLRALFEDYRPGEAVAP